MLNKLKKQIKNEKGLTLIELLAVIVIIAIIAAIAIPAIGNIIENSRYNAVKADGINVLNAANLYFVEGPKAADGTDIASVTVKTLKDDGFLDSPGKFGDTAVIAKDSPNKLSSTAAITYSGSKTVTFTNATVDLINADVQKGSAAGNKTIPGTPPTTD